MVQDFLWSGRAGVIIVSVLQLQFVLPAVERQSGIEELGIRITLGFAQVSDFSSVHNQALSGDPAKTGIRIGDGFNQLMREHRVGGISQYAIWIGGRGLASGNIPLLRDHDARRS